MAIKYVNHSLRTQPNLGKGHGPVNHLNSIQIKKILDEKCSCSRFTVGR